MSSHGHRRGRKQIEIESPNAGFQIAPMIDVVFVIMLFFMVMANSVKVEHELKTALPGIATTTNEEMVLPDDITINIGEDDVVSMNEEAFDVGLPPEQAKRLPGLTDSLTRLKKDADARGSKVLVTLVTEEQARYGRIIEVMNALYKAQISNVTFTVGSEEF
ncbi:MAG TPA: biopolymer transporter ExbD [Candidatus Saccharimonadia bacterium]|nr:biopolymer transporter ExbD [Candidatus Saccharimonadia bacterium]